MVLSLLKIPSGVKSAIQADRDVLMGARFRPTETCSWGHPILTEKSLDARYCRQTRVLETDVLLATKTGIS